ncbi:MAG: hypothetical protein LBS22_03170 [Puniceicoccales bacterium]|jgi:hypothetical protein|nr:hypothetical protein [Puniceicoccales bacterium]
MEVANETNVSHFRIPEFLWQEPWNTITNAAANMFYLTPVCFQNSVRNLMEYDVQSLRQTWENVSFDDIEEMWQAWRSASANDIIKSVTEFAKKHYFIAAIVGGVAIVTCAPLVEFALISPIKLLHLLTKSGQSIASPAFKLILKWTLYFIGARVICHMDLGQLNSITSAISRKIDQISVFLATGTMVLAIFMVIASIPL